MKNALKAMPQESRKQNERQLKSLRKVCGEAMSKLAAQKNRTPSWRSKDKHDPSHLARR
jgi:hypothetical protein